MPYQVNQGNHERDFGATAYQNTPDSGGECGISTEIRFPSPTQTVFMQDQGWWAITHGSLLIVSLASELEFGPGSDQYDFLNATLHGVNRSATPWVFVTFHRPMYFVEGPDLIPGGGAIDPYFQLIEPLLMQTKVDLVAVGHVHNAFASCPVYNGTCVTPAAPGEYDAPIHVCIGNAGAWSRSDGTVYRARAAIAPQIVVPH